MENLETSKDKIKKICEILKVETLEPAQDEARQILEIAQQEARQIIKDAETKVEETHKRAKEEMQKERELFESSLNSASKLALEALKQDIEDKLFNDELANWVDSQTRDPQVGARLINALVEAVQKEGTSADFSAYIPSKISPQDVNSHLVHHILEKLKEKTVIVGDFMGGVQLKLRDRKITLDLSDEALKELLGHYIRKDFRELILKS